MIVKNLYPVPSISECSHFILNVEMMNLINLSNISRKTVGNFIAGNDTSSEKSSQSKPPSGAAAASGGYDEKNAPHSKLPVDTYYYPGTRYCYYLMDIEVTRVGHCK